MRRVRELEVWTSPGHLLPANYGKDLQYKVWEAGIPEDVFLGLSNVADGVDVKNLKISIERNETDELSFFSFCREKKLQSDINNINSANLYMEHLRGRCIAWIHLPEDSQHNFLDQLKKQMHAEGLVIVEPFTGDKI